MSETEIVAYELVEPCPDCGALMRSVPTQAIVRDRLACSISSACDVCGYRTESCDWDELPDELRQLLLNREGTARLHVDPQVGRSLRLPILQVLRRYGATLSEASDTYEHLTSAGITGTTTEMRLLENCLHAIGATTRLDIERTPSTA